MVVYEVPKHLSHSQSSNLLGEYCGAAYFYGRVLGKPERPGWAMLGGSALHEASEAWDWAVIREGLVDDSPEYLRHLFAVAFDKQIADTLEHSPFPKDEWNLSGREIKTKVTMDGGPRRKDEAWWREMGPEMLRLWTAWRLTSGWEIAYLGQPGRRCTCQPPDEQLDRTVCACGSMHFYCECGGRTDDCSLDTPVYGIEIPFEVDVAGETVRGFIDRVFEQDGQYLVVDLKSGRQPDDTSQLGVYRYGLAKQYGIDPRWGTFWLGGTGGATTLTDLHRLWPDARVEQRYAKARMIQLAGAFTHKPSNLCGSCGVREYCPIVGGEKAAETPQPWDKDVQIQITSG